MELIISSNSFKTYSNATLIFLADEYKLWVSNKLINQIGNAIFLWCGKDDSPYTFKIFKSEYVDKKYIRTEEREITPLELKELLDCVEYTHTPKIIEPIYNQEAIDELRY
jgi:hypothetical protein